MTDTSKPHRIITEVGTWPLVGLEGKEARLLTVEYPPGAHTPPHRHPGWQLIYVIKGKVTSQMEGEPLHDFNTGEHWFEPREHLHIDAGNDSPDARQDPRLYITEPGQPVLIPEPDHTSS